MFSQNPPEPHTVALQFNNSAYVSTINSIHVTKLYISRYSSPPKALRVINLFIYVVISSQYILSTTIKTGCAIREHRVPIQVAHSYM